MGWQRTFSSKEKAEAFISEVTAAYGVKYGVRLADEWTITTVTVDNDTFELE